MSWAWWGGPVGVLPRPLPVLTAAAVVPTAAAGRVGLATAKATEAATGEHGLVARPVDRVVDRVQERRVMTR